MDSLDTNPMRPNDGANVRRPVLEFCKHVEEVAGVPCWMQIYVYTAGGRKLVKGEQNNMSPEDISSLGPTRWGKHGKTGKRIDECNAISLFVKHVPDLYVVDFDTKELEGCELKDLLDEHNVAHSESWRGKGYHYFLFIRGVPQYSQQQKVYRADSEDDPTNFDPKFGVYSRFEVDLIKKNNSWERQRTPQGSVSYITGDIKSFDWEDLKRFFNVERMIGASGSGNTLSQQQITQGMMPAINSKRKIADVTSVQTVDPPLRAEDIVSTFAHLFLSALGSVDSAQSLVFKFFVNFVACENFSKLFRKSGDAFKLQKTVIDGIISCMRKPVSLGPFTESEICWLRHELENSWKLTATAIKAGEKETKSVKLNHFEKTSDRKYDDKVSLPHQRLYSLFCHRPSISSATIRFATSLHSINKALTGLSICDHHAFLRCYKGSLNTVQVRTFEKGKSYLEFISSTFRPYAAADVGSCCPKINNDDFCEMVMRELIESSHTPYLRCAFYLFCLFHVFFFDLETPQISMATGRLVRLNAGMFKNQGDEIDFYFNKYNTFRARLNGPPSRGFRLAVATRDQDIIECIMSLMLSDLAAGAKIPVMDARSSSVHTTKRTDLSDHFRRHILDPIFLTESSKDCTAGACMFALDIDPAKKDKHISEEQMKLVARRLKQAVTSQMHKIELPLEPANGVTVVVTRSEHGFHMYCPGVMLPFIEMKILIENFFLKAIDDLQAGFMIDGGVMNFKKQYTKLSLPLTGLEKKKVHTPFLVWDEAGQEYMCNTMHRRELAKFLGFATMNAIHETKKLSPFVPPAAEGEKFYALLAEKKAYFRELSRGGKWDQVLGVEYDPTFFWTPMGDVNDCIDLSTRGRSDCEEKKKQYQRALSKNSVYTPADILECSDTDFQRAGLTGDDIASLRKAGKQTLGTAYVNTKAIMEVIANIHVPSAKGWSKQLKGPAAEGVTLREDDYPFRHVVKLSRSGNFDGVLKISRHKDTERDMGFNVILRSDDLKRTATPCFHRKPKHGTGLYVHTGSGNQCWFGTKMLVFKRKYQPYEDRQGNVLPVVLPSEVKVGLDQWLCYPKCNNDNNKAAANYREFIKAGMTDDKQTRLPMFSCKNSCAGCDFSERIGVPYIDIDSNTVVKMCNTTLCKMPSGRNIYEPPKEGPMKGKETRSITKYQAGLISPALERQLGFKITPKESLKKKQKRTPS